MKQLSAYYILLVGALLWCLSLFIPVLVALAYPSNIALTKDSYTIFSIICHQIDSHSIHIIGHKLGVCARCSSIYFGFLAGVILVPFGFLPGMKNGKLWLLLAITPMLIDVVLSISGIYDSTMATRIFTGLFFGSITAGVLAPLFIEGYNELMNNSSTIERNIYESQTR